MFFAREKLNRSKIGPVGISLKVVPNTAKLMGQTKAGLGGQFCFAQFCNVLW